MEFLSLLNHIYFRTGMQPPVVNANNKVNELFTSSLSASDSTETGSSLEGNCKKELATAF